MSPETQPRYLQGLAKLREIDGHAGERVVASLADIAPDFARYLIEFPFGDIYSRPDHDPRPVGQHNPRHRPGPARRCDARRRNPNRWLFGNASPF